MQALELRLPFPPSVNRYWRNAGRTMLSREARAYHVLTGSMIMRQLQRIRHRRIDFRVAVNVLLHPPDRRKRDLDNYLKAILDTCTKSQVWKDDSLVQELHLVWGEIKKPAAVVLTIEKWNANRQAK